MAQILETLMLISFGISWPISLNKSIQARTAVGTSPVFMIMIILGYLAGITAKIISHSASYVLIAYLLNLAMVTANLCIYFRNRNLDRMKGAVLA
ncbi:MAG: hypothetical protein R3Y62_07470 [Eubacteriales bacterium]